MVRKQPIACGWPRALAYMLVKLVLVRGGFECLLSAAGGASPCCRGVQQRLPGAHAWHPLAACCSLTPAPCPLPAPSLLQVPALMVACCFAVGLEGATARAAVLVACLPVSAGGGPAGLWR